MCPPRVASLQAKHGISSTWKCGSIPTLLVLFGQSLQAEKEEIHIIIIIIIVNRSLAVKRWYP